MLALAAAGWLCAAVVMGALWRWHLRLGKTGVAEAAAPLVTGALAVIYANAGEGASVHGSAIAWMVGSWGARLSVYLLWDEVFEAAPILDVRESLATFEWHALEAVFFAIPALLASFNRAATLSPVELAAAALWLAAFAGETTADRQFVRWRRERAAEAADTPQAATDGGQLIHAHACRVGVWRYLPHAHDTFELLTWTAHAAFAWSSPFGWVAAACPVAVAYRLATAGTRRAQLR
jgi:steroid 5-alpha reductase family enzyme